MKKKILSLCLLAIVAVTTIAGASLAYLTDRESAKNEFTFGNVEIQLNEEFNDNELIPGKKLAKEVTVTNTGKNDAWVWVTVAVPVVLDSTDASKNVLHMNIPGAFWDDYYDQQKYVDSAIAKGYLAAGSSAVDATSTWNVDAYVTETKIDNVDYKVYTHLYNGALAPKDTTNMCLSEVYLDAHVDIDPDGNLYWVEKGTATPIDWNLKEDGAPSVYVSAYAIQEEGFATVEEAYAAYAEQWGTNGTEYGAVTMPKSATEAQ